VHRTLQLQGGERKDQVDTAGVLALLIQLEGAPVVAADFGRLRLNTTRGRQEQCRNDGDADSDCRDAGILPDELFDLRVMSRDVRGGPGRNDLIV
jgi:hypothetical protein